MTKLGLLPRHSGCRVHVRNHRTALLSTHSGPTPEEEGPNFSHTRSVLNRFSKTQQLALIYLDSHFASVDPEVSKAHRCDR